MSAPRVRQAHDLMMRFAERTGLSSVREPRRYLWTDAFAVCNFLGLWQATADAQYRELAVDLVDQVHDTLGKHRNDDARRGWISGLHESAGAAHPTLGGLRIGKPLPERRTDEPADQHLEWDRDGQYFHYLTKWMHALDQVARMTNQSQYNIWARELAAAAWRAFVYSRGTKKRMYWKMSIDLSCPLVPSMGHHDPLDGFITCVELDATAAETPVRGPDLSGAAADYAGMLDLEGLVTIDPLGLGGLFADASRVAQLAELGLFSEHHDLHAAIEIAARTGLRVYLAGSELNAPADARLAFRELGLAIGLAGEESALASRTRTRIEEFWLLDAHRRTRSWVEHADINDVMLATSLVPEGYLALRPTRHEAAQHAAV